MDNLIKLYDSDESVFVSNGLGCLSDAKSLLVSIGLDGTMELEMDYPTSGIHYNEIKNRRIIFVKPNPYDPPQAFRIYKISSPINEIVTIYAEHVSYDLIGVIIGEFKASTLAEALEQMKNKELVTPTSPFTYETTIAKTADLTLETVRNAKYLLLNEIRNTYGGEFVYDNFKVKIVNDIGSDNGVVIEYGKNLQDFVQEEDSHDVYTGVIPFWSKHYNLVVAPVIKAEGNFNYNRTYALDLSSEIEYMPKVEDLERRANEWLANNDITKPHLSLDIKFLQLSNSSEYSKYAILEKVQLGDIVTVRYPDLNVNVKVRCIKTIYDALLDRYDSIELGDPKKTITDTIAGQGNSINDQKTSINQNVPSTSDMEAAIDAATKRITGCSGGYVVIRNSKTLGDPPDEILIMDNEKVEDATNVWRWNNKGLGFSSTGYGGKYGTAITSDGKIVADFITTGTLTSIIIKGNTIKGGTIAIGEYIPDAQKPNEIDYRFKVDSSGNITAQGKIIATSGKIGGCEIDDKGNLKIASANIDGTISAAKIDIQDVITTGNIATDSDIETVNSAIATLETTVTSQGSSIELNTQTISDVSKTAGEAKTTADNANTAAGEAKTTAGEAKTTADNAKTTADNANTAAGEAKTTADNAKTTADNAKTTAGEAKTTADTASKTADAASKTASDAKKAAEEATTNVATIKATTDANSADIKLLVNTTEADNHYASASLIMTAINDGTDITSAVKIQANRIDLSGVVTVSDLDDSASSSYGKITTITGEAIKTTNVTAENLILGGSIKLGKYAGTEYKFSVDNNGAAVVEDLTIKGGEIKLGYLPYDKTYRFKVSTEGKVEARSLALIGGSISLKASDDTTKFEVDSLGKVQANSLNITGGSIELGTDAVTKKPNFKVSNDGHLYIGPSKVGDSVNYNFKVNPDGQITAKGVFITDSNSTIEGNKCNISKEFNFEGTELDASKAVVKAASIAIGTSYSKYTIKEYYNEAPVYDTVYFKSRFETTAVTAKQTQLNLIVNIDTAKSDLTEIPSGWSIQMKIHVSGQILYDVGNEWRPYDHTFENRMLAGQSSMTITEQIPGKLLVQSVYVTPDKYLFPRNVKSTGIAINANYLPDADSEYSLGSESNKWKNIYAATPAISTSDRRLKTDISLLNDKYSAFFDKLEPSSFKLTTGTSGRTHIGLIAQDVETALTECGLTNMDFAGIIRNDEENFYGLRYEEFITLCIKEIQDLKQQIKKLQT